MSERRRSGIWSTRPIGVYPTAYVSSEDEDIMLALGMWPNYVAQLGVDEVIEAAVTLRTAAHLYPMACEDYGAAAEEIARYRAVIDRAIDLLSAGDDKADNEALALLVAALSDCLDIPLNVW